MDIVVNGDSDFPAAAAEDILAAEAAAEEAPELEQPTATAEENGHALTDLMADSLAVDAPATDLPLDGATPEFPDASFSLTDGPSAGASTDPLDEMLAELLASELDPTIEALGADLPAEIAATEQPLEETALPEVVAEAPVAAASLVVEPPAPVAEALAEEFLLTTEPLPAAEPLLAAEALPPAEHLLAAEPLPEPLPEAQPLLAAEELLEPEAEPEHMELLAEEATAFEEPSILEEAAWVEMPAYETAGLDVYEVAVPLPPQPALEAIVGTIDRALETAPAVIAPVETPATHHKQFSQLDDYIVFALSGSDYAVPVRDVAEIGRIPSVTRVPNVPDFVRGITNLRGEVVPVLNLPSLLGLQDTAPTARGRIVFLQAREPISPTGLIVDEVKGIQRIQSQQLEQVTGLVDDKVTSVLRGVHGRGERLLNVLDLEQLFQLQEVRELAVR